MMTGIITPEREATIPLVVLGATQHRYEVEAVLDTGFNGYLTLPSERIVQLNLFLAGNRQAILGDGRVVVLDVYLAQVLWHDRPREVLVLQAEGGVLIGMALVYGSRVTLDVVEDGKVTIQELPSGIES